VGGSRSREPAELGIANWGRSIPFYRFAENPHLLTRFGSPGILKDNIEKPVATFGRGPGRGRKRLKAHSPKGISDGTKHRAGLLRWRCVGQDRGEVAALLRGLLRPAGGAWRHQRSVRDCEASGRGMEQGFLPPPAAPSALAWPLSESCFQVRGKSSARDALAGPEGPSGGRTSGWWGPPARLDVPRGLQGLGRPQRCSGSAGSGAGDPRIYTRALLRAGGPSSRRRRCCGGCSGAAGVLHCVPPHST